MTDIRIGGMEIFNNPFTKSVTWVPPIDSIPSQYIKSIAEWALERINRLQVKINKRHPYWLIDSTRGFGQQFEINPKMDISDSIKVESHFPIPSKNILPLNSRISVFVYVWIDKMGRVITHKIKSVFFYKKVGKGKYIKTVMLNYNDENENDITAKPSGDYKLSDKLRKYIKQCIENTAFMVNKDYEYFKYHDAVRIILGINQ